MATITISAPVSRRTVIERRPVASARRTPASRKPLARKTSTSVRMPAATVVSNVVIPPSVTVYAATGATAPVVRASSARPSGVRLTTRGRRLARTAVIVLALLAALAFSISSRGATSQAGDGPAVAATTTVVVQPGQTLWSVARGLSRDVDIRETVARIQELNGLSGAAGNTVRPGQALIVPVLG